MLHRTTKQCAAIIFSMESQLLAVLTLLFTLSKVMFVNSRQEREESLFTNNKFLMIHHQPNLKKSQRGEPKEAATQCTIQSFAFTQLTREVDIRFYTGFPNSEVFEMVFNQLKQKASNMHYWRGLKETVLDDDSPAKVTRSGRRIMTLEQEFLLTMMRIRTGIFQQDLAFRFGISEALVSRIFTTWIKLMQAELSWLMDHSPFKLTLAMNHGSVVSAFLPNKMIAMGDDFVWSKNQRYYNDFLND